MYVYIYIMQVWLMVFMVHVVEAYFLNPQIYSSKLKLHPLLVLVALYVTEHCFGIGALFLAGEILTPHSPRPPVSHLQLLCSECCPLHNARVCTCHSAMQHCCGIFGLFLTHAHEYSCTHTHTHTYAHTHSSGDSFWNQGSVGGDFINANKRRYAGFAAREEFTLKKSCRSAS